METKKIVFVTGGTGNQGGAIARSLHHDPQWTVKVLSRNPNSSKSQDLQKLGIDVVQGDLNHAASYIQHLKDAYGVFSVQTFEHGIDQEILQGKQLAEAAKKVGIQHFIYSSVSGSDKKTGIPHFESKNEIEKHIKQLEMPYSIIRPTSFFENLLNPEVKKRILKGKLVMPLNKNIRQDFISVQDIGSIGLQIFNSPSKYLGQTITIASENLSLQELANQLSESMQRKIKYEKLPGFITRLVMGKNLYKMFKWINNNQPQFVQNLNTIKEEFGPLTSLEDWLETEFNPTTTV